MYIVLEGIDGVGKSTQVDLLSTWLIDNGYVVEKIVEPTDSEIGKLIRKELTNPEATNDINQQRLALLFAADRLTLKKELINVKGNSRKIIISDRSFYSSLCYQNSKTIEPSWIYKINKYAPRPDLTIILDINETTAIKRCDNEDTFENKEFLEKTRKNYLNLLEKEENMIKIDASETIQEVQKTLQKEIEKYLGL